VRLRTASFDSKQEAEQHGLEVCRAWVNKYEAMGKKMDALQNDRAT